MVKKYLLEQIIGTNIHLEKLNETMSQMMFNYICEDRDRLSRFLPWPQYIKTIEDEIKFIRTSSDSWKNFTDANFGIFKNTDNVYMGNISAFNLDWNNESCEIGYWIFSRFEGMGYIRESLSILEKEIYRIGFNRIVIMCDENNTRSKKIADSMRYSFEGVLRDHKKENGRYSNSKVYSKLKREFLHYQD